MSIALSKVQFDVPSNAYVPTLPWTSGDAKDPKYFYENDNVLWCDPTNPAFPAHGTLAAGVCNAAPPTPQTCQGTATQTCAGGSPQTCSPTTPQTCGGATPQTCGLVSQFCGSSVPQTCDTQAPQTCQNIGNQTCGPPVPQSCNGVTPQSCGGFGNEPCVGVTTQVCNFASPSCNAAPITCGSYDPPGCDTGCGGHECPICTWNACPSTCSTNPGQTCTSPADCPSPGTCSTTGAFCDAANACPTLAGTCSPDGGSCFDSSTCPMAGSCSASGAFCHPADVCPTLQGHCSSDGAPCFDPGGSDCLQNEGRCSLQATQICTSDAQCSTLPGTCTITNAPCFDDLTCARPAICSGTHAACTSGADCPPLGGVCTVDLAACTPTPDTCAAQAGYCSLVATICHSDSDCPAIGGTCSNTGSACDPAVSNACPTLPGACSVDHTSCFNDAGCAESGAHCSIAGNSCTKDSQCPLQPGSCTVSGTSCSADTDCNPVPSVGTCQGFASITCTANSDCPATSTGPAAAVCSDLLSGTSAILNGNFESPLSFAPGMSAFFPGNHSYETRPQEPGIGWKFSGNSGIQIYYSDWGALWSGDGYQTAFLQNDASIAQTLALGAGTYTLSFTASRRWWSCPDHNPSSCAYNALANPIEVSVDGVQVGGLITPSYVFFEGFTVPITIAVPGIHTISFSGTDTSGDKSIFIDAVTLNSGGTSFQTLWQDADTNGLVCRHNNKDYGGGANRYNYPDAQYNTPVTGGTGQYACTASPRYASVPRHYWQTSIEWCDHAVTTQADKWLGYGTQASGSCQSSSDTTHIFPRFFQFGVDPGCTNPDPAICPVPRPPSGPQYADNYGSPAFQRVDLDTTATPAPSYTHDWYDDSGVLQPVSRTFAQEMTNYANWFAYYRTRITAVKTVTSLAFNVVDDKYRVGLHSLSTNPPNSLGPVSHFIDIDDFTPAQKQAWLTELYSFKIPLGFETPSLDAMVRVGQYYATGHQPQLTGSTDPITLSCQKNWHFFFTDGYTNQPSAPLVTVGNVDGTPIPTYPIDPTPLPLWSKNAPIPSLPPAGAWPPLYHENTLGTADSLSDYALQYWLLNMRPAMTFNVPASPVDPATWQHMNFAAIALGTSGKLPSGSVSTTEGQIASGALTWPQVVPSVNQPDASGVDDLWHAAVNGRGDFVNAQTPDDVKLGIGQLLAAALNSSGGRSGVGFVNNTFGPSANFLYRAGFEPGWGGTLTKIPYDPTTGVFSPQVWDAADQLTAQLQIDIAHGVTTPWFTNRKIVTMDESGTRVPFLWAKLGPDQQDSLAPGAPARGQAILEFLRGNRAKEGVKLGQFRKRPVNTVLGDFVGSTAVFVGPPNAPYLDGNDPGYSGFASANATRAAAVYAGANDGMLHVFDDATGNETWAYVPTPLFRGGSAGGDFFAGLGALALQDGALPAFRHHFYVDSTPRVVDVDFNVPSGDWHSLLVGALGKGGNRYYALDVTNPVTSADAEDAVATGHVLWEFPPVGDTSTDMGYTYGRPIIAKTRAFGGQWLVIVPSGYNNPTGLGKLYFLKASDGTKLFELTTGVGSAGNPSGLAQVAAYTKDFRNQLVEQIYGGDLQGNFWRFDVSDPNPANWQATVGKLATLVDGSGAPQPVTTPPEIKIDPVSGIDRWVFVGTGRLLDDSDLNPPIQQQTMYAFRDGNDTTPLPLPATPLSRSTGPGMQAIPHGSSTNNFGLASKPDNGWFDDLPAGQQVVVAPVGAIGLISYIGTSPPLGTCFTGLPATVYARMYSTGQSVLEDAGGAVVESYYSVEGAVGAQIVAFAPPVGSTGSDVALAITTDAPLAGGGNVLFKRLLNPAGAFGFRMSWRLLGQ